MKKIRSFAAVLLLFSLGLGAFAGGQSQAPAAAPAATPAAAPAAAPAATPAPAAAPAAASATAKPAKFSESPLLAAMVAKGELPAVEKRLPEEPLVVKTVDSIGTYGGTLRLWSDHPRLHAWEPLVKVDTDGSFHPNMAVKWEINADLTEFVFHLRRGVKWSDGAPFSSKDILFMWDDVYTNKDMPQFKLGNDGMKVAAVDDYTIKVTFPKSQPTFMMRQSIQFGGLGFVFTSFPKHYLSKFHPKYTDPTALAAAVKAAGMDTWDQLFVSKYWVELNPEVPVITPWKVTTISSAEVQKAERNPYYWKVDAAGNQLPYIDYKTWPKTADKELGLLRLANGEIDFTEEGFNTVDFPSVSDFAAKGKYRVVRFESPFAVSMSALSVNQNYQGEDKDMAAILRDLRFRQALSVAMNRKEINEFVALGQSIPAQATVPAQHPQGSKELSNYMIQFDAAMANKLLDEMGLNKRDSENFRLKTGGGKLTLVLSPRTPVDVTVAEILKKHFESVGIRTSVSVEDNTFWFANKNSGMHMISMFRMQNGNPEISDTWWIPNNNNAYWAPMEGNYVSSGGKNGVKPSGIIQEIVDKYQIVVTNPDAAKRAEALKWVVENFTKNLFVIGTVTLPTRPVPANNSLGNVPATMYLGATRMSVWEYSQFYFKK